MGWPLGIPQLPGVRGAAARLLHRLPVGPGALAEAERDGVALGQAPKRLTGARRHRHTPITTTGHPSASPRVPFVALRRRWGRWSVMRMRLEPEDDYFHAPDADPNYNESRYYNFFDPDPGLGGWVRMGNRPNEGYAEMTVCLYLPDGRVGFMFKRPRHRRPHRARRRRVALRRGRAVRGAPRHLRRQGVCARQPARDGRPRRGVHEQPARAVRDRPPASPRSPNRAGGEPEWDEGEEPPAGVVARLRAGPHRAADGDRRGRPHRRPAVRPRRRTRVARPLLGPARLAEHLVVPMDHRQLRSSRHRVHAPGRTRRRSRAT